MNSYDFLELALDIKSQNVENQVLPKEIPKKACAQSGV